MEFHELRKLLTAHFQELLSHRKLGIAKGGRLDSFDKSVFEASHRVAEDGLRNPEGVWSLAEGDWIEQFATKYGLQLKPGTKAHGTFREELKRAYRDYCGAVLQYDHALETYDLSDAGPDPIPPSGRRAAGSGISLRDLTDRFVAEGNLGSQWGPKTQMEKAEHIALLSEVLGDDTDVGSISSSHAQRMKDVLTRYPKNRKKDPRTRTLTLEQALSVEEVQRLNLQTLNKYLQTYGSVFRWAKRNGFVQENAFDGITVKRGKKSERGVRTAFSDSDVRLILDELLHNHSGHVRLAYQKWGPLIAAYSGARLNEIAQIHIADIRQENGIWFFDLNDDDESKKLKTDAACRRVPIHSRLLELKFLDYVQTLRVQGDRKLFPKFEYCAKNGWGRSLGRWFNDQFLVKLSMKKRGVSFHCFRHTVITQLLRADVELPVVQAIVGHERQGVTHQNYFTSGYTLTQLQAALENLHYADS